MEMHLHTRNISAAAMYMKEQRSTQLKILVVGIAGIKLQKVRLTQCYIWQSKEQEQSFWNPWLFKILKGELKEREI